MGSESKSSPGDTACRLCAAPIEGVFTKTVLGKFEVSYFRCSQCGSLQTEKPYWLAEAYAGASLDPGSVQRCLNNFALVMAISGLLGAERMLDYGGGGGLLCRLLRDAGCDAWWFDRYRGPGYASGFVANPELTFDLVTAFEVWEHLPNPSEDLDAIFRARPKAVVVTTELYRGQQADWWYIAPIEGQHVFFYSPQALRVIADRYRYNLVIGRGYVCFTREPIGLGKRVVLQKLVRPVTIRLLRSLYLARANAGSESDMNLLTEQLAHKRRDAGEDEPIAALPERPATLGKREH